MVDTSGYSKATITFINTSNQPQEIHSYFKPLRRDVQPLGFDVPDYYDFYGEVDKEYESLAEKVLALIRFIYRPGDYKTVYDNPDRLIDVLRGFNDAKKSNERTEKEFGRSDTDNDLANAFKHAYWNALMTKYMDYDFAKYIADNHELNPGGTQKQTDMDFWNNKVGRDIGEALKDKGITDEEVYAQEILKNANDLIQNLNDARLKR
jgi:hypothetical protein